MERLARPLTSLLTLVWLCLGLAAMCGGWWGTAVGLQALLPPAPPPGVEAVGEAVVVTWGDPAAGARTASTFLGMFAGLMSALAVVVAPLLVVDGRALNPLAWAARLGWEILRRPKAIGLTLVLVGGGPCIGLAEAWEQPYAATLTPDRVVLHTALQDVEGRTVQVRPDSSRRFWLRLDGDSLECHPTADAAPQLDTILEALEARRR